jgi:apolipoprotein D and lipocalin family protein
MRLRSYLVPVLLGLTPPSASAARLPDPAGMEVVPSVDLERYLGTWFEIATIPQFFQRGCHATTATYSLRDDGDIRVVNACRKDRLDGELSRAEGKAWVVDPQSNAKLKVQFQWPFSGDYWIIELGEEYDYAVVGHPNREYLWILHRQPWMEQSQYDGIVQRMTALGYDPGAIVPTEQPPRPAAAE